MPCEYVAYTTVYFMAGCDFLPSIFIDMGFDRTCDYTVQAMAERGLFDAGVVELKGGRWSLRVEEGATLLAICYLMLHHKLLKDSCDGPAKVLNSEEVAGDVKIYVNVVRTTI